MAERYGTDPTHVRAGIGPHIAASSYEVGPAEVADVHAAFPHLSLCEPTREGHACLSLERAIRHQLTASGVRAYRVESAGIDTRVDDRFFSHRAERPCGRFALVAALDG
jgi:polyphenol oxidase